MRRWRVYRICCGVSIISSSSVVGPTNFNKRIGLVIYCNLKYHTVLVVHMHYYIITCIKILLLRERLLCTTVHIIIRSIDSFIPVSLKEFALYLRYIPTTEVFLLSPLSATLNVFAYSCCYPWMLLSSPPQKWQQICAHFDAFGVCSKTMIPSVHKQMATAYHLCVGHLHLLCSI